jgi:homoserine kinase
MTDTHPINEVEAACQAAKRVREAAAEGTKTERPSRWPAVPIGIGVGIGSAALAAALLYANRTRNER